MLELVTGKCVSDQFLHFSCHGLPCPSNYDPMQIWLYLQRYSVSVATTVLEF